MTRWSRSAALAALVLVLTDGSARAAQPPPQNAPAQQPSAAATVAAIQIRGNHTTPDDEVLRLAAIHVGDPAPAGLAAAVKARLDASNRFRSTDVRTRYASITDRSAIVIVIVLEERVGVSIDTPVPGPLRWLKASSMWMPVLRYDDGYGFTYGARLAVVDIAGPRSRVSAPLTWGAERRASLDVERTFERGPLTRISASGGVWRTEHPFADAAERREEIGVRAERAIGRAFRVGTGVGTASVHLGDADDRETRLTADAALDTRLDPAFPRNAVFVSLGWDRLWFRHSADTDRVRLDAQGYLGLFGRTVLAVRAQQVWAADALPLFDQPLLGGTSSLRGFRYGYRAGDRLAAFSAELRVPFSPPLQVGRAGWALFVDRGAVYAHDTSLSDAGFDTGIGAGLFAQLPGVTFRVDVAHGLDHGTRAHVTIAAAF
jgi:hypothetical protein